jgi:hypothetical protein
MSVALEHMYKLLILFVRSEIRWRLSDAVTLTMCTPDLSKTKRKWFLLFVYFHGIDSYVFI